MNTITELLGAGTRASYGFAELEQRIGQPLGRLVAPLLKPIVGKSRQTHDLDRQQFLYWMPFELPHKRIPRLELVTTTAKGKRMSEGLAYLAFVASQAWRNGKYGAPAHLRWGIFIEGPQGRYEATSRALGNIVVTMPPRPVPLTVQPVRPVPGFEEGREPPLWHSWAGRQVDVDALAALGSVEALTATIAADLRDLYTACMAPATPVH